MVPISLDKTAPIAIHGVTTPTNVTIQNPITYLSDPSITLNNPADDEEDTYLVESVAVSSGFIDQTDPNADRDGSSSGEPRDMQKILSIEGWVKAPSLAKLYDKIEALNRAFNPYLAFLDEHAEFNPGFLALQFAVTTTNTADWSNGYMVQQYYVRSISLPVPVMSKFDDFQARFNILLRAVDPRRYEATLNSVNRSGNGNLDVDNSKAHYPSWPIIELAFTNTPAAAGEMEITRSNVPTFSRLLVLDTDELQDADDKTLIIDCENRTAQYSNGIDKTAALTIGSRFFDLLPAAVNVVTLSGDTPAGTTMTVKWHYAFP